MLIPVKREVNNSWNPYSWNWVFSRPFAWNMHLSRHQGVSHEFACNLNCMCDQICQKGSYTCTLSRHTFHCYLLATSMDQHNGTCVKGWTVCFHSGLFLKPVWCPRVFGWPSNGSIFPLQADRQLQIITRLADEFVHWFSCFVWHVEVKMAPMEVIWLFFCEDVAFAYHFMAPRPSPPSHPIGVLVVLAMSVKTI